ncbi:MAG TPA: peptide chain release factor N(5)-glutamine methyltransferase [Vicinamibacteria bacterium]|nr:peptide chain release factor N(5)-glutamine methyltransferase [Vicinamibacteria bacterium]
MDGALRRGAERLAEAGVPDAAGQSERLLRHILRWDRAALLAGGREPLEAGVEARFLALVGERARRRPLQHLTGSQAFWRHEFLVTPDVLIPRPETEVLVEAALELLRGRPSPVIVDVGTGSGCIALSLAAERADAIVHAVDLSAAALAVAGENARRLGLGARVRLHHGDLLDPVAPLGRGVDLVVSNPPYVHPAEVASLAPEVRDHEPRTALFAPDAPYGIYRRLVAQAPRVLRQGGHVAVEVGRGMAAAVSAAFRSAGFESPEIRRDLADIERVVIARTGHPRS